MFYYSLTLTSYGRVHAFMLDFPEAVPIIDIFSICSFRSFTVPVAEDYGCVCCS